MVLGIFLTELSQKVPLEALVKGDQAHEPEVPASVFQGGLCGLKGPSIYPHFILVFLMLRNYLT